MSEPIADKLSRFTPDAGELDRDALLFEAGRASVRPNRGWKALAGALAATQVLSLVLLWPREVPQPTVPIVKQSTPPASAPAPAKDFAEAPSSSMLALHRRMLSNNGELGPPQVVENMQPDEAPLRAFPISTDQLSN